MKRAAVVFSTVMLLATVAAPALAGQPSSAGPNEKFLGPQDPSGEHHLWVPTPNVDEEGNCHYTAIPEVTGLLGAYTLELVVAPEEELDNVVLRQTWSIHSTDTNTVWKFEADTAVIPQAAGQVRFEVSLLRGRGNHVVAFQDDESTPCPG